MHIFLKGIFWFFFSLYVLALVIFLHGEGYFGGQVDEWSAIGFLPLGLPWWTFFVDFLDSQAARTWLVVVSPLFNLAILFWLMRLTRPRSKPPEKRPPGGIAQ